MQQVVIVGAGQAGAAAAAKLRALGYAGSITLIGAEAAPPYQRPPLSKAYLLGEMEDGTKYAMRGSWVKDEYGSISLKNYCFSRIPGKYASDTARWEKCDDYTNDGGIWGYEFLERKFIDPSDSTKFLKSTVNPTEDSIVLEQKAITGININIESNLQAFGY